MKRQTTALQYANVTLQVAADGITWEQFCERIQTFQHLRDVEQVTVCQHSNTSSFPTEHWATVAVTIQGTNKARLRQLYHAVTRHADVVQLRLTGRSCILTDLYD